VLIRKILPQHINWY